MEELNQNQKKNLKVLKPRSSKLLLAVIIVAFYLRLQGVNSGLPYILNPGELENLIKLLGVFKIFKFPALINLLEINSGTLLIPLRFFNVLFGIGTVIVVYFLGLRFNSFVAVIASGLLAVSVLHVKFSQVFVPFGAVIFFCLLSSFFIVKTKISNKDITLSAIFSFLSFLIHPIGIISIIPVLFVLLQEKSYLQFKPLFIKLIIIALLLNLNYLLHLPGLFFTLFKNYLAGYYNYYSSSYFLYIFSFLLMGIGPVAYFGSLWLLKYRKDYDLNLMRILFSLPILYIGILGFLHFTKAEFAVLIIPYFCISAGLFFNSIYERANTDSKKFIFILLLLFLFWLPLKYTLKYNKILSLPDTRIIATEWIKENTSDNFKIAWDKNSIQPNWHDAYDKQELKYLGAELEVLISRQRFPVSLKLLEKKDWFKILRKKVDYVVINNIDYEQVLRQPGNKPGKKYYKKIFKLKPEIVFNPYLKESDKNTNGLLVEELYSPFLTLWQRERSGPVIKVYKL